MRHELKSISISAATHLCDDELAAVSGGLVRRLPALGAAEVGLVRHGLKPGEAVELNPQPLPPRLAFPIY